MGPSSTATYAVARGLAQLVRVAGTRLGANETAYWNQAKAAWNRVQGRDSEIFQANGNFDAEGGGDYPDATFLDDKFIATVELFLTQKARGETVTQAYKDTINSTGNNCQSARCLGKMSSRFLDWEHDYSRGNLSLMAYHLMAGGSCTSTSCTGGIAADIPDLHLVRSGIIAEADNTLSTIAANGYPNPIAGHDYCWGSNKVAMHGSMILAYAHHLTGTSSYLSGIHQSLDYVFGQNTHRLSFVTGHGTRFEVTTHDPQANGNSPLGWLSGGPINASEVNAPVTPTNSFSAKNYTSGTTTDFAQAWCAKENTVDWNAPLAWVVWGARNPSGGGGGCTPATCSSLSAQCGSAAYGCGGTLSCGTCSGGSTCNASNQCESSGTAIPARMEAETYNSANESTPTTNSSGMCDRGDGDDMKTTSDPTGGTCNIGWTSAGEWVQFNVNAATAASFNIDARVAANAAGNTIRIDIDGVNASGNLAVPATGWQGFSNVGVTNKSLSAGAHTIRITFVTGSVNLNHINVTTAASCTPATCSSLAAQCGCPSDGCGGTLSCGSCSGGNTCNASFQCVASCTNPGTPAAPTGTAGLGQVSLSWAAVSGASTYTVSRSTTSGGTYTNVATGLITTSYVNTGLTGNTTYFYKNTAVNSCGSVVGAVSLAITPFTCTDGVQNGGETGVDCGGSSCGACSSGEPCTPQATKTGGQSGNFNTTGAYCFRTADTVNGWGCSNFTGRTVAVNSTNMSCGGMPMPTRYNGYYFNSSASSLDYASIYWW